MYALSLVDEFIIVQARGPTKVLVKLLFNVIVVRLIVMVYYYS